MTWRERLDELAAEYALPVGAADRLARLLELVGDDPFAPTTVRDPATGAGAHVADSLTALALEEVRLARTVADIGSGAGFPGLPLAIALPAADVALVESAGRKCAFLERAVTTSGAANARVVRSRAEEWGERDLDLVCARAVAPLSVLVEYAAPLLRIGGSLVAWKGAATEAEIAAGRASAEIVGLAEVRRVAVPGRPGAERHTLHVYSKLRETPPRFPRRAGMARKRPLQAST